MRRLVVAACGAPLRPCSEPAGAHSLQSCRAQPGPGQAIRRGRGGGGRPSAAVPPRGVGPRHRRAGRPQDHARQRVRPTRGADCCSAGHALPDRSNSTGSQSREPGPHATAFRQGCNRKGRGIKPVLARPRSEGLAGLGPGARGRPRTRPTRRPVSTARPHCACTCIRRGARGRVPTQTRRLVSGCPCAAFEGAHSGRRATIPACGITRPMSRGKAPRFGPLDPVSTPVRPCGPAGKLIRSGRRPHARGDGDKGSVRGGHGCDREHRARSPRPGAHGTHDGETRLWMKARHPGPLACEKVRHGRQGRFKPLGVTFRFAQDADSTTGLFDTRFASRAGDRYRDSGFRPVEACLGCQTRGRRNDGPARACMVETGRAPARDLSATSMCPFPATGPFLLCGPRISGIRRACAGDGVVSLAGVLRLRFP